ncbi:uncharacterized protein FFM5_03985 [Fusarium fujikuroi]|nr:uncharacterized protein FFM5_03985 [Fusarium fujikuroi]
MAQTTPARPTNKTATTASILALCQFMPRRYLSVAYRQLGHMLTLLPALIALAMDYHTWPKLADSPHFAATVSHLNMAKPASSRPQWSSNINTKA